MHRWLAVPILLVALPLTGAENLVRNPSFEQFDEAGRALVWQWHAGRAVGEHAFDTQLARTGRASLRITNPTPRAPHVFCHLEQTIAVSPNRQYTLSAYARGGHAGGAWIGGGEGWKVRRVLPAGSAWQRCEITFTSGPEERAWTLMILSEDGGPPLWIDDLQLEEGPRATAFELPQPLEPGAMELRVIAGEQGVNKLPNASFEKQVEGQSAGWRWDRRNTDATCTPDGPGHSGRVALRFTNGTAFGAHVYGSLSLAEPLPVAPNTTYTLSYWCRTTGRPGRAWVGGGTDWRVRLIVPHTNGEWQRVSTTFTTGDQDTSIPVLAVIESPSPPFWIDDVQLEPGAAMTAFEAPDTVLPAQLAIAPGAPLGTAPAAWKPELYPPGSWAFCDRELTLDGLFSQPAASTGTIEVRLKDGDAVLAAARHAGLPIRARLQARWGLPAETPEQLTLEAVATPTTGPPLRETRAIRLITVARVDELLREVEAGLPALRLKAVADDQTLVTVTVLENFVPFCRQDLSAGAICRAYDTAAELVAMLQAAQRRSAGAQAPRYVTSPLTIDGASFLGTARMPDGTRAQRPIQFTGYGHFGAVKRDVEKFPGYGHNLIQIEFGPRSVLVAENEVSTTEIEAFLAVCDRAAKANVAVNLLLSPHYFPDWALEKWPELREFDGGFLRYCIHDARAKDIVERSLRTVIPRIKDHPALHSLCLSNEPVCVDMSQCEAAAELWHAWLVKRFGDVGAINQRWGTTHASIAAIPVPKPTRDGSAMTYDYTLFNQESFAAWHRWMADVIHSMAPDIPVHAKIMIGAHFQHNYHGDWGVAPELFGELSQINGNDCWKWPDSSVWSCAWELENAGYDYQRSAADAPVFNSENHLIVDGDVSDVDPTFVRNVFWQGAVHGQSATTTWVWERTLDGQSAFTGSLLHRPACVEAVGRTSLDLNRLAPEIAALQAAPAQVAILWSQASSTWRGDAHGQDVRRAYVACNFLGVPLGFVNERDAARYAGGERPRAWSSVKLLLVAGASHLPPETAQAIERFAAAGGRVLRLGEAATHDETGRPRAALTVGETAEVPGDEAAQEALCARLRPLLRELGIAPDWDPGVFGVETRCAEVGGRLVANLCNYRPAPVKVTLGAGWADLLAGGEAPSELMLAPNDVAMVARAR